MNKIQKKAWAKMILNSTYGLYKTPNILQKYVIYDDGMVERVSKEGQRIIKILQNISK